MAYIHCEGNEPAKYLPAEGIHMMQGKLVERSLPYIHWTRVRAP